MDNKPMINDIIAMLDSSVSEGVGHVNITVTDKGKINLEKTTTQTPDAECGDGDLACKIPNLLEGVED